MVSGGRPTAMCCMTVLPAMAQRTTSPSGTFAVAHSFAFISRKASWMMSVIKSSLPSMLAEMRLITSLPKAIWGLARPTVASRSPVARSCKCATTVVVPMSMAMPKPCAPASGGNVPAVPDCTTSMAPACSTTTSMPSLAGVVHASR